MAINVAKSNWGATFPFLEIVIDHYLYLSQSHSQIVIGNQEIPYVEAYLLFIYLKLDLSYAMFKLIKYVQRVLFLKA